MSLESERRCECRNGCEAEVEWAHFNRSEFLDGRLLNVSPGGGCLESPQEITGRCTLLIRLKRYSPQPDEPESGEGFRSIGLAYVKWCRLISDGREARYAIGLKYIDGY